MTDRVIPRNSLRFFPFLVLVLAEFVLQVVGCMLLYLLLYNFLNRRRIMNPFMNDDLRTDACAPDNFKPSISSVVRGATLSSFMSSLVASVASERI